MADKSAGRTIALIMAAGRGLRAAAGENAPKQYVDLGGDTALGRSLNAFASHQRVEAVMAVIGPDDEPAYARVLAAEGLADNARLLPAVVGGKTRQESVANGLEALAQDAPERVLIHDAARPFVSASTIGQVIDALDASDGALPVLAIADTIKRLDQNEVVATEDRSSLGAAQTPQGFRFEAILAAHRRARTEGRYDFTDDAAVGEWAGLSISAVPGDPDNGKITSSDDLLRARARSAPAQAIARTRTGSGFDVHAFGPGEKVRLCGIDIAHNRSLKGHSDADVALHALTDALYGAIGSGDIGHHFPPSEAKWKDVDSSHFLLHAKGQVERGGWQIEHVDVTIICERPKIGPHRQAMVNRLGELLGLAPGAVSVKATTTERLGFAGRGEGIAAQAVATISQMSQ